MPSAVAIVMVLMMAATPVLAATAQDIVEFEPEVRLGAVPAQAKITYRFSLRNKTQEVVRVQFKASDCGCTSSQAALSLRPNESGSMEVRIAVEGRSQPLRRRLLYEVHSRGQSFPLVLQLGLDVESAVVQDRQLKMGEVEPAAEASFMMPIAALEPWRFDDIAWDEGVRSSGPLSGRIEGGSIIGRFLAPRAGGHFRLPWTIRLTHRHLPVQAELRGAVQLTVGQPSFADEELFLGAVRVGEADAAERDFVLLDPAALPQDVAFHPELEGAEVHLTPSLRGGAHARVRVPLQREWHPGLHEVIMSYTLDRDRQELRYQVPLRLVVLPETAVTSAEAARRTTAEPSSEPTGTPNGGD